MTTFNRKTARPKEMPKYIIRFDDFFVGMERQVLARISEFLLSKSIPAIIGVVPAWKDVMAVSEATGHDEFWETVRELQRRGCEIAMHGCYHVLFPSKNLLNVNRYGEFAGLDIEQQKDRLRLGLEILAANGVTTRMFMAPAHSFDLNTIKALREVGIPLMTDGKSFYPFMWDGVLFLPQISSSFRNYPCGIVTICLHPQWMTNEIFEGLSKFCRTQGESIVGTQYGVDYFHSMSAMKREADRVVRGIHQLKRGI